MGKGDKKSRRGKIIIGSTGVRRPKSAKRKGLVQGTTANVEVAEKTRKAAEKPKAEPKAKVAAIEPAALADTEMKAPKAAKKAVKKSTEAEVPE